MFVENAPAKLLIDGCYFSLWKSSHERPELVGFFFVTFRFACLQVPRRIFHAPVQWGPLKMQQHNYWTRHVFSYIQIILTVTKNSNTLQTQKSIISHIIFLKIRDIVVISYRLRYIAYSQTSAGYPWRSQLQGASRRVARWHQVPWAPWVSSPWYSHGLRDR